MDRPAMPGSAAALPKNGVRCDPLQPLGGHAARLLATAEAPQQMAVDMMPPRRPVG